MKYRVQLVQTITETAWVMVDAADASEAELKATNIALGTANNDQPLQWHAADVQIGSIEANAVEPAY